MFPALLHDLAEQVLDSARAKGLRIATAESCTGGLIAACLTEIAGASDVVDRGFVVYSNESKTVELSVPEKTLAAYGAVSEETAREMASGAFKKIKKGLAVSVTGIAGPGGSTAAKPIGLVYIGIASDQGVRAVKNNFSGDRNAIRLATVQKALEEMIVEISKL